MFSIKAETVLTRSWAREQPLKLPWKTNTTASVTRQMKTTSVITGKLPVKKDIVVEIINRKT
jgi:hypothetical protein